MIAHVEKFSAPQQLSGDQQAIKNQEGVVQLQHIRLPPIQRVLWRKNCHHPSMQAGLSLDVHNLCMSVHSLVSAYWCP
jgi:hypothetical protein